MYIEQSLSRFNDPLAAAHKEDERKRRGIKATPQPSAADRQQIQEDYLKKGITKQRQESSYIDQRMDEIFGEGLRNAQAAERRKSAWMDLENSKRDPIEESREKIKRKKEEEEEKRRALYDRNLKNMAILADINKTNRS